MESTRILAIRHGETAWNVDTRIQGQLNIGLNDTGLWQAQQVGKALADEPIAAIYSSDLDRAFTTAQSIAQSNRSLISTRVLADIVQPHTGLRERHFGHFEGMTWAEIEDKWPTDAKLWRSRDPHWSPQGGEQSQDKGHPLTLGGNTNRDATYHAVHSRRGDFQYSFTQLPANTWANKSCWSRMGVYWMCSTD